MDVVGARGDLYSSYGHTHTRALEACEREQQISRGRRPTQLVYRVIDEDAMHWPEEDIGNLRVALNALVRLFRL